MTAVFLDYDQEELDRQYDQGTLVPDREAYSKRNRAESDRIKKTMACEQNIAYGPSDDEVLDVFSVVGGGGAPVQILIHGGAWTRGHKDQFAFPAEIMVPKGIAVVVPGFSLAPTVSLGEMVRQNRAAIAWVHKNIAHYGGDPERLYVTGTSSGGHLSAMMMVTDWEKEMGLPADLIAGATSLSGIYELEPARLSYRNDYLHLDDDAVARLSPIRHLPQRPNRKIPMVVGHGDGELKEFQRQSREFAIALTERGYPVTDLLLEGCNHFDVVESLSRADSPAIRATFEMMGLAT